MPSSRPQSSPPATGCRADSPSGTPTTPWTPPNSKPPAKPNAKYSSSLKIWDNKPDFEAKLAKLTQSINESRGKAKDLDSVKTIVNNINQNCDSCHESYQVRNQ